MRGGDLTRWLAAILILSGAAGCATLSAKTEGTAGPVVWHWTDARIIPDREYTAVLALLETTGRTIVFTSVSTHARSPGIVGTTRTAEGRWTLPAYGELRLPMSARMCLVSNFGSNCGVGVPRLWEISLTGRDDRGGPVKIKIDVALPVR